MLQVALLQTVLSLNRNTDRQRWNVSSTTCKGLFQPPADTQSTTWLFSLSLFFLIPIPSKPESAEWRKSVNGRLEILYILAAQKPKSPLKRLARDLSASRQTEKSAVGIQLILLDIHSLGPSSSTLKCTSDCDCFCWSRFFSLSALFLSLAFGKERPAGSPLFKGDWYSGLSKWRRELLARRTTVGGKKGNEENRVDDGKSYHDWSQPYANERHASSIWI